MSDTIALVGQPAITAAVLTRRWLDNSSVGEHALEVER